MHQPTFAATPAELGVPVAHRERVAAIVAITDATCDAHLDTEYAELCRRLLARLARKHPCPLGRGEVRLWAAGTLYAVGQLNFLFDRSQDPHMSGDELAEHLRVVKSSMANKAALIRKALDLRGYEPELMRRAVLEQPPFIWVAAYDGRPSDHRSRPARQDDQARAARPHPRAQRAHGDMTHGPRQHAPAEAAAGHPLSVSPPYLDHHCRSRPYAVTSRIGSITRTEHYSDREAAARGAEQARRDLALLATRLDDRR